MISGIIKAVIFVMINFIYAFRIAFKYICIVFFAALIYLKFGLFKIPMDISYWMSLLLLLAVAALKALNIKRLFNIIKNVEREIKENNNKALGVKLLHILFFIADAAVSVLIISFIPHSINYWFSLGIVVCFLSFAVIHTAVFFIFLNKKIKEITKIDDKELKTDENDIFR